MAAGSIALLAVPVQAATPSLKLVLAPAVAIVSQPGELAFTLVNAGAQPLRVTVSSSDAWVTPSEADFELAAGDLHTTAARVQIPSSHEPEDHETDVRFAAPAQGSGLLRVAVAVAARIIIGTGGTAIKDLRIYGLSAPLIADSFDSPTVNVTLDNSRSNTHVSVAVPPFRGQALLLRGQTKHLSLSWTNHPFVGVGTIAVGNQVAHTIFVPWKAVVLLAILASVAWAFRRRWRSPSRPI